jgi:hypothetical protein
VPCHIDAHQLLSPVCSLVSQVSQEIEQPEHVIVVDVTEDHRVELAGRHDPFQLAREVVRVNGVGSTVDENESRGGARSEFENQRIAEVGLNGVKDEHGVLRSL